MIKKIFVVLALLVVVFVIVVLLQPAAFRIERSTTIAAPAADVYAQVANFHNWEAWSPWAKLDPDMKKTFDGPEAGTGAMYAWTGNAKVGEGRMTIGTCAPDELIRIQLEFLKPFKATNIAEFSFKQDGDQTAVTWSMTGRNNFISKAFCLFMDMDKMVGADFEKGLASLKTVCEGQSASP